MNQNDYQNSRNAGYGQQSGAPQGGYGWPGYQPPQGYPASPNYQGPKGYPGPQGMQNSQAYQQTRNYQPSQSHQPVQGYQTPQVTGSQKPVGAYPNQGASYPGQNSYIPNPYAGQNQGYGQYQQPQAGSQNYGRQQGYPPQQGYPQQPSAQAAQGYPYQPGQAPGSSYIPQTPYSQGYTTPGYQTAQYGQGYNAYAQMGRTAQQQPVQAEYTGQVPLNGGGYVPQPVPVRRKPFVMTDADLLILSAILLIVFALGMFVPTLGLLKWVFLALAAGTIALIWMKPLVATNKRLCYTIVFALLSVVTIVGFIAGSGSGAGTEGLQGGRDPVSVSTSSGQSSLSFTEAPAAAGAPETTPSPTPAPSSDSSVTDRLQTFFFYWSANRQDDMLTLCSPSWQSKVENPKTALFGLMANRTPKDYSVENISGTEYDTSRTVTVTSLMDRNNGKDPVRYRLSVIMTKESEQWYVDPQSLQTYEAADTPDPSITETPGPTDTPAIYPNTVLYYNPSGGEYYHLDQNCKRINERYLPLKGHFTFSELSKSEYSKLKPCAICGAPSKDQ